MSAACLSRHPPSGRGRAHLLRVGCVCLWGLWCSLFAGADATWVARLFVLLLGGGLHPCSPPRWHGASPPSSTTPAPSCGGRQDPHTDVTFQGGPPHLPEERTCQGSGRPTTQLNVFTFCERPPNQHGFPTFWAGAAKTPSTTPSPWEGVRQTNTDYPPTVGAYTPPSTTPSPSGGSANTGYGLPTIGGSPSHLHTVTHLLDASAQPLQGESPTKG